MENVAAKLQEEDDERNRQSKKRTASQVADAEPPTRPNKYIREQTVTREQASRKPGEQFTLAIRSESVCNTDLLQKFEIVWEQVSNLYSDGLPLMSTHAKLLPDLKGLEDAARKNDGWYFRSMLKTINKDLSAAGYPTLSNV